MNSRCPSEVVITCDNLSENWSAAVWDPCTGSLLHHFKNAGTLGPHSLQLLKDSYLIASSAKKANLHLWPLNSQVPVQNFRLGTPGIVTALASSFDGSYIAAATKKNDINKIYIWQTCNGRLLSTISKHYQTINCLIFNSDGSCLASGGEDGLIFVWVLSQVCNEEEDKPLSSFSHSQPVKDLYFGKVGPYGRLYSVSLDRSCHIYNVYTQQLLLNLIFDEPLNSVSVDIMENNVYVGSLTGSVIKCSMREPYREVAYHVSMSDKDKTVVYKGHEDRITSLSVSTDCITLLSGSADGMVHLWDIQSCQILITLKHKAPVVSAFFATAYPNFKVQNLEPSLKIKPFEQVSKQEGFNVLEVCKKEDDSWLFDFEKTKQFSINKSVKEDELAESKLKLESMSAEVERLKKVNAALHRHLVKNIID